MLIMIRFERGGAQCTASHSFGYASRVHPYSEEREEGLPDPPRPKKDLRPIKAPPDHPKDF